MAVDDAEQWGPVRTGFRQSFASAAKQFRAIDGQAQRVVVAFENGGKALISELSAAYDLAVEFRLLRRAERFIVNVFPRELESLKQKRAVYEVQPGSGILYLSPSGSCGQRSDV